MNRPTPNPAEEGSKHSSPSCQFPSPEGSESSAAPCQFPSWEGLGVGSWSQHVRIAQ